MAGYFERSETFRTAHVYWYLREQGCEDLWLFFEAKRGLGKNVLETQI